MALTDICRAIVKLQSKSISLPLLFVACLVSADSQAEDAPPMKMAVSEKSLEFFEKEVRPILATRCFECHSVQEANGGLSLDTRAGVLKGGDSGAAIVPGEPAKSRLIEAIRYQNRDLQMPPKGPLSPRQIAALEQWVSLGAPDPRGENATVASARPRGMSIEEGRTFWSFKPLTDPSVPEVRQSGRVQTPLDAFILAKLEANGLAFAPPADKRTLLRRVTFDLTGLPPTPEELAAFLADNSPEAFDKVVDRLLASPQYGVRWGRHWLDVARYADSNGLDENITYGHAWRYRDYVVQAFQRDKPFDRFLIEQLAGDLLPEANAETKTATGFLALGAKVLAEPDMEKLVMDTIDEQLDTVGKTFLGLTLGCVRCHDHKFDPVKQIDYYALAAIFKSTKTFAETKTGVIKHWYEHSFATDADNAEFKKQELLSAAKKNAANEFKNQAIAKLREAARAKAVDYLLAAAKIGPDASPESLSLIAEPLGLQPRVLQQCRTYLLAHGDLPFFQPWHDAVASNDWNLIDKHYRSLFAEAEAAFAAVKKEDAQLKTLNDPRLEAARAALYDSAGFLALPAQPEVLFTADMKQEYDRRMEEARRAESTASDAAGAMGVSDGPITPTLPIHIRGSHRNLGEAVPRGFPRVLLTSHAMPAFSEQHSGRLEFAKWLASAEHPLTARVYVNRVWRWHFGTGLVSTTENFGKLGDRPSHPELLDWLTRQFIASGWSTKSLHRLILASATYQQRSDSPADQVAAMQIDPENRWLWKFPLRRLEAEEVRDAILFTTGRLDLSLGGKTVPLRNKQFVFDHTSIDRTRYDSLRRAIYLPVIRNNLYTLFEQFDFPDPTMPTGHRNTTTIAPQALLLMNDELVMDSADVLARNLLATSFSDERRIGLAYERTLGRSPSHSESRRAIEFVQRISSSPKALSTEQSWSLFCQSLLASNEFIYVR